MARLNSITPWMELKIQVVCKPVDQDSMLESQVWEDKATNHKGNRLHVALTVTQKEIYLWK